MHTPIAIGIGNVHKKGWCLIREGPYDGGRGSIVKLWVAISIGRNGLKSLQSLKDCDLCMCDEA